jgi:hypothetical protein
VDTVGTFNLKQNKRMSQHQSHSFHWFPSKKKLAKKLGQNFSPGSICEKVVTGTVEGQPYVPLWGILLELTLNEISFLCNLPFPVFHNNSKFSRLSAVNCHNYKGGCKKVI